MASDELQDPGVDRRPDADPRFRVRRGSARLIVERQDLARLRHVLDRDDDLEIERLSGMANLIESERDKAGRPLVTLAALTRMLPDDTYINELQLQQHKLTISGRSAAASRLISALSAGNQLRNPTFAAPVTRIEATRSEIFTITAEVGP